MNVYLLLDLHHGNRVRFENIYQFSQSLKVAYIVEVLVEEHRIYQD